MQSNTCTLTALPSLCLHSLHTRQMAKQTSTNGFHLVHWVAQGSSRTETHGNAVLVLFLYNGNVVPVVFFCILQLLTVILSSLIFINLVGSPLTQFNPLPYVKMWLAHGHRGAYDNQSRKRHATEESRYSHLNKIFEWLLSISEILLGTMLMYVSNMLSMPSYSP